MSTETAPPADTIRDHDEVIRALSRLRDARDTCTDPAGARSLTVAIDALRTDPTLALTPAGQRALDLVAELCRQLRPVIRQADLSREHARLTADDTLTDTDRARRINRLGKINPNAIHAEAELLVRLNGEAHALAGAATPDWQTPGHLEQVAHTLLPSPRVLAEIAQQIRDRVAPAAAVAPTNHRVRGILGAAAQLDGAVSTRPTQDDARTAMDALIETIGLTGLEDVLDPAVAYIHDRHALYGEPPLWGRDTGIACHALALAIRAYANATASVDNVDAWDVSRMEHETDVLRDRIRALEAVIEAVSCAGSLDEVGDALEQTTPAPTRTHHTP